MDATGLDPQQVYHRRFEVTEKEIEFRREMWKALCQDFFQKYIPEDSVILEVAAGYCEFINNIRGREKIAVDINVETRRRAHPDVRVFITPSTDLSSIAEASVDIAFVSNFFEHLERPDIVKTIQQIYRVLCPGGKLLVLQPNVRFIHKDYWMFWDHITPIDDRALCELMEICGFKIQLELPRFLPYTTKSRLPKSISLIRAYLRLPVLFRFFGGQAFLIGEK